MSEQFTSISDCTVGEDSRSGKAVAVWIDGIQYWVPYSQIKEIHRDPRSKGADCIVVTTWFAKKEGWT